MSDQEHNPADTGAAADLGSGPDPAVEQEARSMGWVPQEHFRGDPSRWVDASTFVERGHTVMPILRKNNEALQHKLQQAEQKLGALQGTVGKLLADKVEGEKRAYERAKQQLRAERAEAMASGDGARVAQLDDALDELRDMKPADPPATAAEPAAGQPDPARVREFMSWVEANPWYRDSPRAQRVASTYAEEIRAEGWTGTAALEEIKRRMQAEVPDLFGGTRRTSPVDSGAAAGSGGRAMPRGGKRTAADLPADARAVMNDLIRQRILTAEEYLANYEWDA